MPPPILSEGPNSTCSRNRNPIPTNCDSLEDVESARLRRTRPRRGSLVQGRLNFQNQQGCLSPHTHTTRADQDPVQGTARESLDSTTLGASTPEAPQEVETALREESRQEQEGPRNDVRSRNASHDALDRDAKGDRTANRDDLPSLVTQQRLKL